MELKTFFLSVAKMALRVYERENCFGERGHYDQVSWNSYEEAWGKKKNRLRGGVRLKVQCFSSCRHLLP